VKRLLLLASLVLAITVAAVAIRDHQHSSREREAAIAFVDGLRTQGRFEWFDDSRNEVKVSGGGWYHALSREDQEHLVAAIATYFERYGTGEREATVISDSQELARYDDGMVSLYREDFRPIER